MIAKIFVSDNLDLRKKSLVEELRKLNLKTNSPDILYIEDQEKLGVGESKKIFEFLSFKPFSDDYRGVVLDTGDNLTLPAQNSLLKILEELPETTFFYIGASNEDSLLETIKSRCEVVFLESRVENLPAGKAGLESRKFFQDIQKLENMTLEERFILIEKIEDKDLFLEELIYVYRQKLLENPKYLEFSKKLLQAEEFKKNNVNIRGILEYLMLSLD